MHGEFLTETLIPGGGSFDGHRLISHMDIVNTPTCAKQHNHELAGPPTMPVAVV